ncbi:MAG: tRNA lysidine(34) synthetase TilS [Treponema sp.]|nr:tRNA lysidine(34) synthetase TilS [Candidatus Treponema equi]
MSDIFEDKVRLGLDRSLSLCGISIAEVACIGAAVSGGADSVSLLVALKNILPENVVLKAITVNHNIRPAEETCGDAEFVQSLCGQMGIECRRQDVPPGKIKECSSSAGSGIEDAARKERYGIFESFMKNESVDFLCLAHNRNDQNETVLMRFLQGSGDLSGIPKARGKYIRPLLAITRKEIEEYLERRGVPYRTDSTNNDNSMLRNRIRNIAVPMLDENFNGWTTAMDSLASKSRADNEALDFFAEKSLQDINWTFNDGRVTFNAHTFFNLQEAIRHRIIMKAVKLVGAMDRIPFSFVDRWTRKDYARSKGHEESCGVTFRLDGDVFEIEKKRKVATESGFFVIIEQSGTYCLGDSTVSVSGCDEGGIQFSFGGSGKEILVEDLKFPFALRSRQSGDQVLDSHGTLRSVSKILDDWKAGDLRDSVVIVEQLPSDSSGRNIKCILGSDLGLKDWITIG